MIDQLFDRQYQSGRAQLNSALLNGFRGLTVATRNAFEVLNRIEYAAPWALQRRRTHAC